ncbi:ABC-type Fe3+ transport system permease subunit [Enterococcus rotai]
MNRRKLKHKGKSATPIYQIILMIFYCISAVVLVFVSFIFFGRYGRPSMYENYKILYRDNTNELLSAILTEVSISLVILGVSILLVVLMLFLKRRKYNRIKKKFPKKGSIKQN